MAPRAGQPRAMGCCRCRHSSPTTFRFRWWQSIPRTQPRCTRGPRGGPEAAWGGRTMGPVARPTRNAQRALAGWSTPASTRARMAPRAGPSSRTSRTGLRAGSELCQSRSIPRTRTRSTRPPPDTLLPMASSAAPMAGRVGTSPIYHRCARLTFMISRSTPSPRRRSTGQLPTAACCRARMAG